MGGLESVVRLLARGQRSAGHRVLVGAIVEPDADGGPFVAALTADGTPSAVIRVPARGYLLERRAVKALCVTEQPSIVHTHGYRPDVIDSAAARSLGVGTVTTVHGFTGGGFKNKLNEWLQVKSLHRFAAVIAVSDHLANRLRKLGVPDRVLHVIPNAFDTNRPLLDRETARSRLGIAPHAYVVGWVGRLGREKAPDILIAAVARMRRDGLGVSIIGDGPERADLEARCRALGIEDVVRFHGLVTDAGSYFAAFDAFALSSRTEGLPVVLLEAMAARVPIAASRAGGVPEMLTDGLDGWLVPLEDPAALAAALSHIRDHPDAAQARAAAAGQRLERDFALDAWVRKYDAVYRSVLTDRASVAT